MAKKPKAAETADGETVKESRWDVRRRRRTEEILEVAMGVVMAEGLAACSLHRIARELDIAVAGLYRYFPSKMALVAALEVRVLAELSASMEAARGELAAATTPAELLVRVLSEGHVYRRYAIDAPARFALISQVMADPNVLVPGALGGQVLTTMLGLLAGVAGTFAQAANGGGLSAGDPVERSVLFWNGIRSVLQMKKLEQHSAWVNTDRLYRSMVTTLLLGWGAPEAELKRAWKTLDGLQTA